MADSPRLEELRRRVQADPASIAFAALAEEYRRAGKFREAVEASRAGLRYHPTYVSARVTLGRSLVELQEVEQAERELAFVLKSAPDNLAARRALGELCWQQLRFGDALTHFRTAHALAPADTELPQILQSLERELAADRNGSAKAEEILAEAEAEAAEKTHEAAAAPAPAPVEEATFVEAHAEETPVASVYGAAEPVSQVETTIQPNDVSAPAAPAAEDTAEFAHFEAISFVEQHDAHEPLEIVLDTHADHADFVEHHDAATVNGQAHAHPPQSPPSSLPQQTQTQTQTSQPRPPDPALLRLERFHRAILAARARRRAQALASDHTAPHL